MSALQTLMEMGFSENASKKALSVVGGDKIEQAMEWLLAHADDPSINDPPPPSKPDTKSTSDSKMETGATSDSKMETGASSDSKMETGASSDSKMETGEAGSGKTNEEGDEDEGARSIKCDDCGKLFQTSAEVEYHAVKSGHDNFSESTEEKKPLSEEEKLQKKMELAEKIKLRRKEREAEEEQEARERERKRIQMGQAMAERKRVMQEIEIRRAAEERRRDKLEDKLARQKVKEQIERDRLARKEMFPDKAETSEAKAQPVATQSTKSTSTPAAPAQSGQKKEYTTTRLQIRLPSGTPLVQEFKAKESLSAVRLWVGLNRTDGLSADTPIKLSTTFPRKTFSEDDMDKPLDLLGKFQSFFFCEFAVSTSKFKPVYMSFYEVELDNLN
ncbi:UBX domain-containing protein 1-like isoform X2 [Macrobrachium nipponense]|uniref:UBX domain-containing protein 1-like isoform X2 n=1 Tax=Macrobrachium nipponense TaxID=159736 RepID=UPI0030C8565F